MLAQPIPVVSRGPCQTNLFATSGAGRAGTVVTASGTVHQFGTVASLIASTGAPSFGIWLRVRSVGASAAARNYMLRLGIGAASTTTLDFTLIDDLDCGNAGSAAASAGKIFWLPVYIPAGVALLAQGRSNVASQTASVAVALCQMPEHMMMATSGRGITYGAGAVGTSSGGTNVTPGNNTYGSWTQISASSARAHRYWFAGYDLNTDTTVVASSIIIQIGFGPDSSNVTVIGEFYWSQGSTEELDAPFPLLSYYPVPAGQPLWVRIAGGETEVRKATIHAFD